VVCVMASEKDGGIMRYAASKRHIRAKRGKECVH
jgi:hypothetical protein